MAAISGRLSAIGASAPPGTEHLRQPSPLTVRSGPPAVFSKYLMNDIPRGTSRAKLINYLQQQFDPQDDDGSSVISAIDRPHVNSGCIISDSRLDDELSVATIEFSDTPKLLQFLNRDLHGFPKKTVLGTLWRGVDISTGEIDEYGRSEYIRAVIEGNIIYAETLAEFKDTDVNVQDDQGRTALHWACAENQLDLISFCLSIPECDVGLRDKDNLTALDLSPADTKLLIPALFYTNMLDMEESDPQTALLRMLTVTSTPVEDKPIFPGEAIFCPIEVSNKPLVKALLKRGIDLSTRDINGDTALHLAVKANDVEVAIRLMNAGSDVDASGKGGATPLHCAAHSSERRMVQALLSWDARPDSKNDHGQCALDLAKDWEMVRRELYRKENDTEGLTPLQRAAEDGDPEIVRLLLELGASVDEENKSGSGQTALMLAARMGHRNVGELLVEAGANIEATDRNGHTPLSVALTEGFSRLLRESGAKVTDGTNTEGAEALLVGMADMHTTIVDSPTAKDNMDWQIDLSGVTDLVVTGSNMVEEDMKCVRRPPGGVQLQNDTRLLEAARKGDLTMVQLLLASGVDIEEKNGHGQAALYIAARNGHTETVQALLDGGAQTEAALVSGATPLYIAAQNGHSETVQALLTGGARIEAAVSVSGETPLFIAANNGDTETVQALLASGAQTEAAVVSGETPLYIAAQNGHSETVQALLTGGAQTEAARVSGETPLFIAAENGHTETVQALLGGGAQTEAAVSVSGETPLFIAAQNGHTETVQALLGGGAQTEVPHVSGATPLFIAAQNGHTETVQALLTGGAQTEAAVSVSGETPLFIAAQNGHAETVQALLTGGAQTEAAVSVSGETPLFIAAQQGHTETVQALLGGGAQTEAAVSVSGKTALYIAAQKGHTKIVQALLSSGADAKVKTSNGKTALKIAILFNHEETAKVLKEARSWRSSNLATWVRRG